MELSEGVRNGTSLVSLVINIIQNEQTSRKAFVEFEEFGVIEAFALAHSQFIGFTS